MVSKFNLFRSALATCLLLHLIYLGFVVYILRMGGSVIFAHPLLPMNEWGQLNLRTPIMEMIVTFISFLYVVLIPKIDDKINEVKKNGKK